MHQPYSFIGLLKQRNAGAFAQLYDQYAPALYRCIRSLVNDQETAGTILANSFRKVHEGIGQFDPQRQKLFIWMVQITVQQCRETGRPLTSQEIRQSLTPGKNKSTMINTAPKIDTDALGQ